MKWLVSIIILFLVASLSGCARPTISNRLEALRPASFSGFPVDTGSRADLELAIRRTLDHWAKSPSSDSTNLQFGEMTISRGAYAKALELFLALSAQNPGPTEFQAAVEEKFQFLEVFGQERWGDVFITGYFEPIIEARKSPEGRFSQPIYRRPADLVSLNLGAWGERFLGLPALRGRRVGNLIEPYFDRRQIDSLGVLQGQGLEIAWADPIDVFFMQIQGSGRLQFPGGEEIAVSYAEKNGHRYEAIGKFLKEKLAPQQITMQAIEGYLRSVSAAERNQILEMNPSYVFFDANSGGARTALGVSATAERTIATDRSFFPKGALAFLAISNWPGGGGSVGRYVVDQDVGGAITGPGRVDLFCGAGAAAKEVAGPLKSRGRLVYLVPKEL